MKKPKIELYKSHSLEEYLKVSGIGHPQVKEAYQDMIDALMQARIELMHLYNILEIDGSETFNVKNIDKALKKAGCK